MGRFGNSEADEGGGGELRAGLGGEGGGCGSDSKVLEVGGTEIVVGLELC